MARILAIDYGLKRTGLAWTDPLQIIATGIGSFDTSLLKEEIAKRIQAEDIESIVLGYPTRMDGSDTDSTPEVRKFETYLKKQYPNIPVHRFDERFSSKMAMDAMIASGVKKKKRRNKQLINELSATIILQGFMESGG